MPQHHSAYMIVQQDPCRLGLRRWTCFCSRVGPGFWCGVGGWTSVCASPLQPESEPASGCATETDRTNGGLYVASTLCCHAQSSSAHNVRRGEEAFDLHRCLSATSFSRL